MRRLTTLTKLTLPTFALYCLTGCQTTPTALPSNPPAQILNSQALDAQQSQQLLVSTIKSSLYHNQDFIAEQQLFLQTEQDRLATPSQPISRLRQIEQCQSAHDTALVAQLKADNISTYKAVKKLTEDKKTPYDTIKQAYIDCYRTADNLPESEDELSSDMAQTADSEDYPEQVGIAMKLLGFKAGQVTNFNKFFAKSGKLTYTGNYRPYQGKLALQVDAGFENKNLRTHYRLPMLADFKEPAVYLKPDAIMPYTALYLDNKLGMSWQDKWYRFDSDPQNSLPASITAKAWLKAVTDSFLALPSEQFTAATPDEITAEILPNLTQSTQKPNLFNSQNLLNNSVIHWHQTAEQQIALTKTTIGNYIATIEQNLASDKRFNSLPESEQTRYRKLWEQQKQQLIAYRESLSQTPELEKLDNSKASEATVVKDTVVEEADAEAKTHNDAIKDDDTKDENSDDKPFNNLWLASRPQGQDWYFVLNNHQLKHIYIDNAVSVFQQPAKFYTWVTFNPDSRTLAAANQPQTLETLAKTLRPEVVIDGRAEMKRLAELDDSRRLFGQEPAVVKYYKDYLKKSKEKAKKQREE